MYMTIDKDRALISKEVQHTTFTPVNILNSLYIYIIIYHTNNNGYECNGTDIFMR